MPQSRTLSPRQEMRVFIGLAVQPLAAAGLGFVGFPLVEMSRRAVEGGSLADPAAAAVAFGLAAGLAALFVIVCGALPALALFMKRGSLHLRTVLCGGALLGNLPLAAILVLGAVTRPSSLTSVEGTTVTGLIRTVVIGACFGLAGAALFWVIAIRGTALDRSSTVVDDAARVVT